MYEKHNQKKTVTKQVPKKYKAIQSKESKKEKRI
jgi:hypothetical protein